MVLDKTLYDEINEYCKLNNLKTKDFIHEKLKEAFLKEKYGDSPFSFNREIDVTPIERIEPKAFVEKLIQEPIVSEESKNVEQITLEKVSDIVEQTIGVEIINETPKQIEGKNTIEIPKPRKKRKLN